MMPRRVRIELLGLQTTYTALFGGVPFKFTDTIFALIGGGAVLDTEGKASFALGYRIDFPLNGSLQNWELVAGVAPIRPILTGGSCPWITAQGTNNKQG